MKQKQKKKSNFCYFNPNPTCKYKKNGEPFIWRKPDCVIRAFCGATELDWVDAFDILTKIGREIFDVPNSRTVLEMALEQFGFKKVSIDASSGKVRPTVNEVAESSTGKIRVLNISHHEVCAKDGHYLDTWDCGGYKVYTYWEKDIN